MIQRVASWARWPINKDIKSTIFVSHQYRKYDYAVMVPLCTPIYIQTHCMDTVHHTLREDSMANSHPDTSLGNVIFRSFPSANTKHVG